MDGWFVYASQHLPLLCMLRAKDVCQLGLALPLSQSPPPQKHVGPKDKSCNGGGNFAHIVLSFHSCESSVLTLRGIPPNWIFLDDFTLFGQAEIG